MPSHLRFAAGECVVADTAIDLLGPYVRKDAIEEARKVEWLCERRLTNS